LTRPSVKKRNPKTRPGDQGFGLSFHDTHGARSEIRDQAFAETIRSIPRGKVASYGQVATPRKAELIRELGKPKSEVVDLHALVRDVARIKESLPY